MKRLVHLDCREFIILTGTDVGVWRHQRQNSFEAQQRLARFVSERSNMATLRELMRRELHLEPSRLTDHQVLEQLSRLMSRGGLAIVQSPGSMLSPYAPGFLRVLGPRQKEPEKRARIISDSRAWIEIKLEDEQERPVANEPYELVLENGSKVSGTLDAGGTARHERIEPGTCKVSFPEWKGRIQLGDEDKGPPRHQGAGAKPVQFSLGTNKSHTLVALKNDLYIRLAIDPLSIEEDDPDGFSFVLFSVEQEGAEANGGASSYQYQQTKTVADDKIEGDEFIDLEYTDLVPGLSYSLEVRHEEGLGYPVLERVPFEQLFSAVPSGDEEEAEERP